MSFSAKKSLGQNFLNDENLLNKITDLGNISNEDVILEVGPGTGKLTERILNKNPKDLIVIEKDVRLVEYLKKKFGDKIKVINEDMMNFPYKNFYNKRLIIFGNLPYNISTQILAKWIKIENLENFCKKFVLMFQKEVADRIIAKSNTKNYGRLSILSNWKMKIEKIIDIEPSSFKPQPKVKSTLLVFSPLKEKYNLKDPKNLEHVTNIFFSQRRKMIKKPLEFLFKDFQNIARQLNLDLNLRPQNLDNITYYQICEKYEKLID
jgi:16S rRNA (adenine1518-N6/adenine1519-N6)-dimethyltransferase